MAGAGRLVLVWITLLILLATTIGASFLPLGPVLPVVSYGIAAIKAALILWFFMELRRENGIARLAMAAGFSSLAFLVMLTIADFSTRGWTGVGGM